MNYCFLKSLLAFGSSLDVEYHHDLGWQYILIVIVQGAYLIINMVKYFSLILGV